MDRGFDTVAPIIHDWTYEPMVYDLLAPEGSTYRYHAENNKGALCSIVFQPHPQPEPNPNPTLAPDSAWAHARFQFVRACRPTPRYGESSQ